MTMVIAGGGLSGLTLAGHLAAGLYPPEPVIVFDDGSSPVAQMGWAFWASRPGLLDAAASRRFHRVRVHAQGRSRVLGLGAYRYQLVRGADLDRTVHRIIGGTGDVTFRHGHVERVGFERGRANVVVDGEEIPARWVFDSISGSPVRPAADARLVFRGWYVLAQRAVFDPEVPTLFDFRTAQTRAATFVYVLPSDAHHALVEHTAFATPGDDGAADPAWQRAALAEYLETVLGTTAYLVEREESAQLPLSTHVVKRRRGDVLSIGTRAGLLKASTGYAYQRVQRDSEAIVRSLARHGHPFDLPSGHVRHRTFDRALLDVISRDPAQLERVFGRLFDGGSAEPVFRFLDEETSPAQERALFSGLPVARFVSAVARHLRD